MKHRQHPTTVPDIETVLKTALDILSSIEDNDIGYVEINSRPAFSSPIEIEKACENCGSNFITEIYRDGVFRCFECAKPLLE